MLHIKSVLFIYIICFDESNFIFFSDFTQGEVAHVGHWSCTFFCECVIIHYIFLKSAGIRYQALVIIYMREQLDSGRKKLKIPYNLVKKRMSFILFNSVQVIVYHSLLKLQLLNCITSSRYRGISIKEEQIFLISLGLGLNW